VHIKPQLAIRFNFQHAMYPNKNLPERKEEEKAQNHNIPATAPSAPTPLSRPLQPQTFFSFFPIP